MMALPCCERIFLKLGEPTRPRRQLIIIQHLLLDTVEFVKLISERYDIISIIGIPYSAKGGAVRELQKICPVVVPRTVADVSNLVKDIVYQQDLQLLILDMGGYCVKMATEAGLPIAGIVEETNQGHWQYLEEGDNLRYPVLSVAQTPIKHLEERAIGQAIVYSMEKILRDDLKDSY